MKRRKGKAKLFTFLGNPPKRGIILSFFFPIPQKGDFPGKVW
jgi:hypothetical protein